MKKYLALTALACSFVASGAARADLVIHAAEVGIGKFHRKDNAVHPYEASNVWIPYVLKNDATLTTPLVVDNADHSVTIYFSHLEELFRSVVSLARTRNDKVAILNLEAHGMPGGMWFPKDATELASYDCASWRESAAAADDANYHQYYSAISKMDIMMYRSLSNRVDGHYSCVTGRTEFEQIAARVEGIKAAFAPDAQIHLISCLVGLGRRGDAFTRSLAQTLLSGGESRVMSSLNFGLGDWSMPEGMGFWDYQNDEQLARDNARYVREKRDRSMAQPGTIRVAEFDSAGSVTSGLIDQVEFMVLTKDTRPARRAASTFALESTESLPAALTIPGTNARVELRSGQ